MDFKLLLLMDSCSLMDLPCSCSWTHAHLWTQLALAHRLMLAFMVSDSLQQWTYVFSVGLDNGVKKNQRASQWE